MTSRPSLCALAVVVRDGHALLVKRRNPPDAGLWAFPGGHVEYGETALAAAARELQEETGVAAQPVEYIKNIDLLQYDTDGSVKHHYLLVAVLCDFRTGVPAAADDALAAAWVPIDSILRGDLQLSTHVDTLVSTAQIRLSALRSAIDAAK